MISVIKREKNTQLAQTYWETGMRSEGLELNLWKKTQIRNQLCYLIENQKGIKLKLNLK